MIDLLAAVVKRLTRRGRWTTVVLLATLSGAALVRAAPAAEPLDLRLHLAWGGGQPRQWSGRVVLSAGTLSDLQLLGVDPDQPGSIQLLGQQILLRSTQPRTYDGLEISLSATDDATLRVELLADGELQAQVVEVPLSELVNGYRSESLDDRDNRLVIRRPPSDLIRVRVPRDHLVYSPGEKLHCTVRGYRLPVAPQTSLHSRLALKLAGSRTAIWEIERRHLCDATGSWPEEESVDIDLPIAEGVYELETAIHQRRRTPAFAPEKLLAMRRVQLVVVSDQSPPGADVDQRISVVAIDPTQANWFQRLARLPQWSLVPGFRTDGPLGNVRAERTEHGGRSWTRLPVGAWQAYPLPVDQIGQLHELDIEYAGDLSQSFAISLIEPNAAGKVAPIGLDSGVVVDAERDKAIAVRSPAVAHHRLLFWPRTKTPLLLVTNLSDRQVATYGKFEVFRRTLPALDPAADDQRGTVAFYERPLFAEQFGAAEALDEESGRSLEDWQTFLDGARRLIQYARYVGYDALAITCVSEGSSLYPSRHLQPTAKHDRGLFFGTAQDPVRKDVLELLFRLCDREGLQLIPVIEFATPLPALEAQLLQPESAEGIALVDASQTSWVERYGTARGRAAYYNPLDERVQHAMLSVVDELVGRYAEHRSFGGVTINLHADGFTQLPDVDWGMDSRTWERFRRERQIELNRPIQLDSATHEAWLEWRCVQLTQLYQQMAGRLTLHRADARLFLAGSRLIDSRPIQRRFRPALPPQTELDSALREIGISRALLGEIPALVLLRPRLLATSDTPAASPATNEFNASLEVGQVFSLVSAGAQFLHDPRQLRLASFDEASPFGKGNTYLSLVTHLSPSGDANRQRFAHALATEDSRVFFEGGWMLPMGQEESLREFLQVYRRLPDIPFQAMDAERKRGQPLQIRTGFTVDASYLYVVNDSPWYVGAALKLTAPEGTHFQPLDSRQQPNVIPQDAHWVWNLSLAPFDLVAVRADRPGVQVAEMSVNLPPDVKPALENQIRALGVRAAQLSHPTPLAAPANRGFEAWDPTGSQPVDWTLRGRTEVVSRESSNVHEGGAALRVQLPSGSLSLRSLPIEVPKTGRLSVSVWARVTDPQQQPRIRLVLEVDGSVYHPWSPIGVGGSERSLGPQWKEFVFRVSQLPSVNDSLRIGIEVAGTGEVYLDDMQLYDILVLDASEHTALTHLLTGADFLRRKGMVADCLHILAGYWPQYLLTNVPEASADVAERSETGVPLPTSAPAAEPAEREASGWERLRRWMPQR